MPRDSPDDQMEPVVLDVRVGLVDGVQFHLPAGDAAGVVDALDGEFGPVLRLQAEDGRRALGERLEARLHRFVRYLDGPLLVFVAAEQRATPRQRRGDGRPTDRRHHRSSLNPVRPFVRRRISCHGCSDASTEAHAVACAEMS
jgi:hypothetical protein